MAVLIHRQRLGQQRQQIRPRTGGGGWLRQALLDAAQDQPQRRDDDVLLAVEVVRDHAGGVAGVARDAHHARLVEAMLGDHAAGHQGDLIAALVVIDDLGHGEW